ncbi:MAG: TIR domain-containing protein [Clostridia bacterium]|nr:TIR domain-containing protein [Clostridia bacterium]
MDEKKYCAFISYRHQSPDQEIAKALHTAVETYGIPASVKKKTGMKKMGYVFRDQEELPLSADLGADIESALDRSEYFIAICSPRYLESRWCQRELEYFIEHKGRDHVLTVLVEGEPDHSFPDMIRYEIRDGKQVETEPLAADVRSDSIKGSLKKLKAEKLRLLAPMLNLSYDDLKRRSRQRKIRIVTSISAAAFAAAVLTISYLIINHERQEALRREAELNARIAAEQTKLAEDNKALAEERQALAEEQHMLAISNEISEQMVKASGYLETDERISAVKVMLDALALSDENKQTRRDEILAMLRKSLYTMPYQKISGFENDNARMTDMIVSPDRTKALGVENMNSIVMLDLKTGRMMYKVSNGNSQIYNPGFSPDGRRFVGSYGTHATVWDTETGKEVYTYYPLQSHGDYIDINIILFWRDADTLLIQDWDTFWFVSIPDGTMKKLYTVGDHQEWYSSEDNFYTYIYGSNDYYKIFTFSESYIGVDISVSKDWSRIMIGGRDGKTGTLVIDEEGRLICPIRADFDTGHLLGFPASPFMHIALSPDGKSAVWFSKTFGVYAVWDVDSGYPLYLDKLDEKYYSGIFLSASVSEIYFSPDSQRFAFTVDNNLYVFDTRTGAPIVDSEIESQVNITPVIKFTEDGKYMLFSNGILLIFDANTYELLLKETTEDETRFFTANLDLQSTFFTVRNDGSVVIYAKPEIASIKLEAELPSPLRMQDYDPKAVPEGAAEFHGSHEFLDVGYWQQFSYPDELLETRTCFSRDGQRAAMLYQDGWIELFDTYGDGSVQQTIGQLVDPIYTFGMVNDRLVASSSYGRLLFWDLENNKTLKVINTSTTYTGFAFNQSGDLMMGMRLNNYVIDVYNMKTAELLFSITYGKEFTGFGFSEDDKYAIGVTTMPDHLTNTDDTPCYLVADLYTDETKLIEHANDFISLAD